MTLPRPLQERAGDRGPARPFIPFRTRLCSALCSPPAFPWETASFFPRARLPPEHICFHEPLDGVPPRPAPGRCFCATDASAFKLRPRRRHSRALSSAGRGSLLSLLVFCLKSLAVHCHPRRPSSPASHVRTDGQALNRLRVSLGLRRPPDPAPRPREAVSRSAFVTSVARPPPCTGRQVPNGRPFMPRAL